MYTTSGPAWQALMTSLHSETSVNYVALMDTRSNRVRMYKAPTGLIIQGRVTESITTAKTNQTKLEPVNMALHQIYGQLTWVAPLVAGGTSATGQQESWAGLALLNATDAQSADVIIGLNKSDALNQYSAQIANGTNNNAPNANANSKSVTGTVSRVDQFVSGGNTFVVVRLTGDPTHLYRGEITGSDFNNLAMSLTAVGDSVTITYLENGSQVRGIQSLTTTAVTTPSTKG